MNKSTMRSLLVKGLQLALTVVVLLLLFIFTDFDFKSLFDAIADWCYIFLALCLPLFIMPVISSNRWSLFLVNVGVRERLFSLYKLSVISLFQGIILPSSQGQDFMRIYNIEKRHPYARGKVGSTILIERLIGFYVLCFLSLLYTIITDMPNKGTVLSIIGIISLLLVSFTILILNKRINSILLEKHFRNRIVEKGYQYLVKFCTSLTYFPYGKTLPTSISMILLFQLSSVACVSLVFKAYGINIPFSTHLSIYPIIAILSLIPVTVGGFGIREGFFVFFYSKLGVPDNIALSVSLMIYCLMTLAPALVGSVFYIIDIFSHKPIE